MSAAMPDHLLRARAVANANYTISYVTGSTLTIAPATLTVTADPQTKVYGEVEPGLDLRLRRLSWVTTAHLT